MNLNDTSCLKSVYILDTAMNLLQQKGQSIQKPERMVRFRNYLFAVLFGSMDWTSKKKN